jgi:hypothetical protein
MLSDPIEFPRLRTRRCMGCSRRPGRRVRAVGLCEFPAANSFAPAGGRHVAGPDAQPALPADRGVAEPWTYNQSGSPRGLYPHVERGGRKSTRAFILACAATRQPACELAPGLAPSRGNWRDRYRTTTCTPAMFRSHSALGCNPENTPRGAAPELKHIVLDNRAQRVNLVELPKQITSVSESPRPRPPGSGTARAEPVRPD